MTKTPFGELVIADRIEIFRHLAVDGENYIDISIIDQIAHSKLDGYYSFCNEVFEKRDDVVSVSIEPISEDSDTIKYNIELR